VSREARVGAAVLALALVVAGVELVQYWSDPAALWRDPYHDRNTHYRDGLNLALDLRALDPVAFAADATSDPIWPPLFPLALAFVLAACGPDHRLAIVPPLLAWCATAAFTAMLAERAAPRSFAGLVAGGLALASPGFRLLGADVMFEALGAALGAAAVLLYMRGPSARRGLALVLTALFLTKYNYWLLIAAPLAVSASLDAGVERTREAVCGFLWGARRVIFSWLGAAGIMVCALAGVAGLLGPAPVQLLGRIYAVDSGLVLTAGYGALFLRSCMVWATGGRERVAALGPTALAIARLHVLPAGLWLLTPRALARLLFFVSQPAGDGYDPAGALAFQWAGFSQGYHPLAPAVAILVLAAIGGAQLAPRARCRSLLVTALLGAAAVMLHPYQQWRFAATTLFPLWVCAGVGAAALARALPRLKSGTAAACAVLVVLTSVLPTALADRVAIRTPSAPSDLALAAAYLPLVSNASHVGVVTTFGVSDLFVWTIREHCRCHVTVDQPWLQRAASPSEAAALTRAWVDETPADRVILVDAPPPYPLPGVADLATRLAGVPAVLRSSARLESMGPPAQVGLATVEVWRATGEPGARPPARRHLAAWASLGIALLAGSILCWPRHRAALPRG
jgi:hypothetical protein